MAGLQNLSRKLTLPGKFRSSASAINNNVDSFSSRFSIINVYVGPQTRLLQLFGRNQLKQHSLKCRTTVHGEEPEFTAYQKIQRLNALLILIVFCFFLLIQVLSLLKVSTFSFLAVALFSLSFLSSLLLKRRSFYLSLTYFHETFLAKDSNLSLSAFTPTARLLVLVLTILRRRQDMGNEGSAPSTGESTPVSEYPSLYSIHSRVRSSVESTRAASPMEPPEPDMSHLTAEEIAQIKQVMDRAKNLQEEETTRARLVHFIFPMMGHCDD